MEARHLRKNARLRGLSLFLALLFVIEPVTLINSWFSPAHAEKKAAMKVAVATVDDASGVKVKDVALKLSDALYIAFMQSGLYEVSSKEKVSEAATSAGAAGSKDAATLAKVGKALSTKVVFSATLKSLAFAKGKPEAVATVSAEGVDSDTGEIIAKIEVVKSSGIKPGYAGNQEFLAQEAINMAASAVVDEFFKYQTVEATVLSTRENKYIVSFGKYHGINPGAEFVVLRKKDTVAVLKATKVSGNDSEAILITKKPGPPIVAGDKAKILHNPPRAVSVDKTGLPKKKKSWTTIAIGIAVIGAAALLLGKKKETPAPEEPVPAVTGVTASPQSDNTIRVSWQPVQYSKLAGYVIYRAEDVGGSPGQFVCAGEVSSGEQFFNDEGKTCGQAKEKKGALTPGKSYWYQVAVKTTSGQISGFSTVDEKQKNNLATAGAKAKPNAPTVDPAKPSGGKAILTWTPPTSRADSAATTLLSSEISGYWVYNSTDSSNFPTTSRTFFANTGGSTQTATVTGLTNNTQYYFVVTTVDTDQQESAYSGVVTATPVPAPAPKAPEWTKKCAAVITNTATGEVDDPNCSLYPKDVEVQLTWNEVIAHKDGTCYKGATGCTFSPYEDKLSGYRVYRVASTTLETDRAKYDVVQTVTPQAGEKVVFSDKQVTNDTAYFYYVRALNDEDTQSDLPADNTDILGPVTPKGVSSSGQTDTAPPTPAGVTATTGIRKITLSWGAVTDSDLDGYYVYYSSTTTVPGDMKQVAVTAPDTSYTAKDLTPNIKYSFFVQAFDKAGGTFGQSLKSSYSSPVVEAYPNPPIPPAAPQWPSGTGGETKPVVTGVTSITLNWNLVSTDITGASVDPDTPVDHYEIWRTVAATFLQGANGDYVLFNTVDHPSATFTDSGISSTDTRWYFYKVRAVLSDGTTSGTFSESRNGQVNQASIVLISPDAGSWFVADTAFEKDATLCGFTDANGNGQQDTGEENLKFTHTWPLLKHTWNPVDGATRYVVEFSYDPAMTTLENNFVVNASTSPSLDMQWEPVIQCITNNPFSVDIWWRVKAVNDVGIAFAESSIRNMALSNVVLETISKLPNAPTGLQIVGTPSSTNVLLSWTAPTCNTDGTQMNSSTTPAAACTTTVGTDTAKKEDPQLYNIYWSDTPDGFFYNIASVAAPNPTGSPPTQYTDTAPQPGVVNYYKVSSTNKAGREGPLTTGFVAANISSLTPATPTGLAATAGSKQVSLTWTNPTTYSDGTTSFGGNDGVLSFDVQRAEDITFTTNVKPTTGVAPGAGTTTYSDSTVINGTSYYYRVRANSKLGFSSGYTDAEIALPLTNVPPASPQNVQIFAQDSVSLLKWDWNGDLGEDLTGFEIWRAPWDDPSQPPPDLTAAASVCQDAGLPTPCVSYASFKTQSGSVKSYEYTDTGLRNGGYYYYWLKAVNRCNDISITTPCADPHSVETPTSGLRVKPMSNADPTVSPAWSVVNPCIDASPCTDTNLEKVTQQWDSSVFITPGNPQGIDLSGYFVYAADLPSTVQGLADSQRTITAKSSSNNYYIADVQLETNDVGTVGDNGTGVPYEALINQFKAPASTTAQNMSLGATYYVALQGYRYVDTNADGVLDKLRYGSLSTIKPVQPYTSVPPPAVTLPLYTYDQNGFITDGPLFVQNNNVRMKWNPPTFPVDVVAYQVLRQQGPAGACDINNPATVLRSVLPVSSGATSYSDGEVVDGQTYCYWLKVVRKGAETSAGSAGPDCVCNVPSDVACVVPPTGCPNTDVSFGQIVITGASGAPDIPTWKSTNYLLPTQRNGAPALILSWNRVTTPSTQPAVKYRIYRSTSLFGEYLILTNCDTTQGGVGTEGAQNNCYVSDPTSTYIDDEPSSGGLDPNTTYFYKIKAVGSSGVESAFSDIKYAQPGIDSFCTYTPGPNQTFVFQGTDTPLGTQGGLTFEWCNYPGASRYLLEVASDSSITSVYCAVTTASTVTQAQCNSPYTTNQLPPSMYWRVSVLDGQSKILTSSSVVAGGQGAFNFQIQ